MDSLRVRMNVPQRLLSTTCPADAVSLRRVSADRGSPSLGTLSALVSLSRSRKCCCLPRVSHSRLHPPAHPVPTRRLPWLGSPAFHRYHECATTSDSPWLALRLSLHACYPVDRFVRSGASNGRLASAGSCSAGVNPSGMLSGRLSDLPSSHETLAPAPPLRDRLTPTPCSQTPAEPPALILSRARHRPQTLKRQGLRQCGQFRGSIARLGARCVRFVPASPLTTQHSLPVGDRPLPVPLSRNGFPPTGFIYRFR